MKKILFIIDPQNDFCSPEGSLSNQECVTAADNIVWLLREGKIFNEVYVTQDTHTKIAYSLSQEGRNLPTKHCIEKTVGHEIRYDILKELKNFKYTILKKSSFGCQSLQKFNFDEDDEDVEVYICGVCTDICVVSNTLLLKTFNPEMEMYIIENCCAGTTPENHEAAINVLRSCQIKPVLFSPNTF